MNRAMVQGDKFFVNIRRVGVNCTCPVCGKKNYYNKGKLNPKIHCEHLTKLFRKKDFEYRQNWKRSKLAFVFRFEW